MSAGGFIVSNTPEQASPSSRACRRHATVPEDAPPLLRLTPKQERRLMTYVEQQVLDIERDFNKRLVHA